MKSPTFRFEHQPGLTRAVHIQYRFVRTVKESPNLGDRPLDIYKIVPQIYGDMPGQPLLSVCCTPLIAAAALTLLTCPLHDVAGRCTRQQARDLLGQYPAALRDFVAWPRLRALRDVAQEDVMMLLFAFKLEEVFGRLASEPRFFLELSECSIGQVFSALQNASRQGPFGFPSNEQDAFAFSTDDGSALLQTQNSPIDQIEVVA